MLIQFIFAALAVLGIAARPRSWVSAASAAGFALAGAVVAGPGSVAPALAATAPMLAFLTVAIGLAGLAVRLGLARQAAGALAWAAGESAWPTLAPPRVRGFAWLANGVEDTRLEPTCDMRR